MQAREHLAPPMFEPPPAPKVEPRVPQEELPPPEKVPPTPAGYYERVERQSLAKVVASARRALAPQAAAAAAPALQRPVGTNGVVELLHYAMTPPAPTNGAAVATPSAVQQASFIQPAGDHDSRATVWSTPER